MNSSIRNKRKSDMFIQSFFCERNSNFSEAFDLVKEFEFFCH